MQRLATSSFLLPLAMIQQSDAIAAMAQAPKGLKDAQTEMIREAVKQARGNVAEAARALGISRATVYRKLGNGKA